jgi:diguanylate cyclase (GGDEF)-like protein/PAS domain S-box-containing protein
MTGNNHPCHIPQYRPAPAAEPEIPYRQFVEESPLGILIIQNGTIKFANAALGALLGYRPKEMIGKTMLPFVAAEDRQSVANAYERRMRGEVVPATSEYRIIASNGKLRHWRLATRTIDWQGRAAYSLITDITDLKSTEEELERSAHFDALTGVPNRILLADRLRHDLMQASRDKRLVAVCYLDIDGFKSINDTRGHQTGDRLLIETTSRLQACLRGGDMVARLGGDEFVLLLPDLGQVSECAGALLRVLAVIAQPVMIGGQQVSISASIGASIYPHDSQDSDTLLRQADAAMYGAKKNGGNRYCFFMPEQMRDKNEQDSGYR